MNPIMICNPKVASLLGIEVGTILGESENDRSYREWQERVADRMRDNPS